MASIRKKGESWHVQIRRKNYPTQTRTFAFKYEAEAWARENENEMDRGFWRDRNEAERNTFGDVLRRYRLEVAPMHKGAEVEAIRIAAIERDPIAAIRMAVLSSNDLAAWRDRRLKDVSQGTVNRELNIISAAINIARREWRVNIENPVELVRRPRQPQARDRRLEAGEEEALLEALAISSDGRRKDGTFSSVARNTWALPLVRIALETAMRRGELLALKWGNIDLTAGTARIEEAKNGTGRTVPLSPTAISVLSGLPRSIDGRVFPISADSLKLAFQRAVKRARKRYEESCAARGEKPSAAFMVDLHFHDLRHEATSRLAEILPNLIELASVTGHQDLRMLRRYYHPRAADLAKKLAAGKV